VYSDDRRLFSTTAAGLAHLLDVACQGCWASGGAVNVSKLKVFAVRRRSNRVVCVPGTLDTMQGVLPYSTTDLNFVGFPLLMGSAPTDRSVHCRASPPPNVRQGAPPGRTTERNSMTP
jgi:hypothetical protein